MKVLIINEVLGYTSTGKICAELAEKYVSDGHEVRIAYGRDGYVPERYKSIAVRIGNDWEVMAHALLTRLSDKHGLGSRNATKRFLDWAENYKPDLVLLHNLHGYYINYRMLFDWIKSNPGIEVKWTLHDCWAFTGHCAFLPEQSAINGKHNVHIALKRRNILHAMDLTTVNSIMNRRRQRLPESGI